MRRITVFCGSSSGNDAIYTEQARLLGQILAQRGMGVVYGGALVGLMGAVAEGALASGGEVIGVIPSFLRTREIAHEGLSRLIVVDSMHERKQRMHDLCDGFIALPGGFGTLEEFFEILTWGQLGLHDKAMGLLDTGGYYGHLLSFLDGAVSKGFLKNINRQMIQVSEDIGALLDKMNTYTPPPVGKWLRRENV